MLRDVRRDVEKLLRDTTLTTLAFAIALGWSLFQVAEGVATLIAAALERVGPAEFGRDGMLSWHVAERVFIFGPLVVGLIELGVVLAAIALLRRARPISN